LDIILDLSFSKILDIGRSSSETRLFNIKERVEGLDKNFSVFILGKMFISGFLLPIFFFIKFSFFDFYTILL